MADGVRTVREGRHECALPDWGGQGELVDCTTCGRRWKFTNPGNPAYAGWRQTWLSMLGRRNRG